MINICVNKIRYNIGEMIVTAMPKLFSITLFADLYQKYLTMGRQKIMMMVHLNASENGPINKRKKHKPKRVYIENKKSVMSSK
jgi:hypothetical protein